MLRKKASKIFYVSCGRRINDFTQPIVKNKMTRLSFGLLPAQSAALYCLEQTIFENATNASTATIVTALKKFYVDDGLFSFPNETELIFFQANRPAACLARFPVD